MAKLTGKALTEHDRTRDLNAELREALAGGVQWARKTEFKTLADGRIRRSVTRRDGTVEKSEIIPANRASVAAARAGTKLSQSEFAGLLGVSVRTLQDWESGRREPSGAAQTLLRIAAKHPRIVRDVVSA